MTLTNEQILLLKSEMYRICDNNNCDGCQLKNNKIMVDLCDLLGSITKQDNHTDA